MFCPDCGSEVAEGRKFCGKCGGQMHAAAGNVEVTQGNVSQETAAPVPRQPISPLQKLTYAIVALLVILVGVGWWWFHRPAPAYRAQDPGIYPFDGLSADGKTAKVGFIDADGKVLLQPEWDAASPTIVMRQLVFFSEGLCGVKKDGKWGFIDTSGHLVISNQFDAVGPFIEGLARVNLGNQAGFIDMTGQYVINPQFDSAGDFHGGLAAVHTDSGWGFINRAGTFVIEPHFQTANVDGFSDGLAGVCQGKCGYIDHSGTFAVKPQFDSVDPFSEGMASVGINGKLGFINTAGKLVIIPQFDQSSMFSGGLAFVVVSGHQGTINKQGKYVLKPGQYNMQPVSNDIQRVTSSDGMGLMTRNGQWVMKPCKALSGIGAVIGKVFYGVIGGQQPVPISISGKVLVGPYKGAMLDTLTQDSANTRANVPKKINITARLATSMLLEKSEPVYPPMAKAARVSGTVVLSVHISEKGTVEELHVVSGPAMLQQAALDAVKTWRYRPFLVNGEPVKVETTVNVIFNLGG